MVSGEATHATQPDAAAYRLLKNRRRAADPPFYEAMLKAASVCPVTHSALAVSREDFGHHFAFVDGRAFGATLQAVDQFRVVEAQRREDCRVQ